ncbi:MAG TPA: hypothetical protein VF787_19545, partial [Thermoanaerobaculia bacterium]
SSSWSPRETRFLTIDANGVLRKELAVPGLAPVWKVDLAADQCTLFYGTLDGIGRINVCTGTMLPPFVNAKEPSDLRITREGDVLVTYAGRIVRYDRAGNEQQAIEAPPHWKIFSLALDRDPRYVWVGTEHDLHRVELATGAVVETHQTFGTPRNLSVVGEPRAARLPVRRRSAGH